MTDWCLFGTVLAMVSFGVLMVYSASSVMAQLQYGSIWHFVWAPGAVGRGGCGGHDGAQENALSPVAASRGGVSAVGIVLVLLGLVYVLDPHHRWLRLGGPFGIQPSELAKPALICFWRTSRRGARAPSTIRATP